MGRFLTVFLVLLLLLVIEIGPTLGQPNCPSMSKDFKGWCWFKDSCVKVCNGEGKIGGYCTHFECWCYHPCY
ncbi:hypothetical protein ACJIZ3_013645 [Penstemon smallii]|uniref:Knottins-like domain-containing protein n=1 Tax=Penstemon smallii TaxID=265156 RepID=A0ABD3RJ77_9LAMI